MTGIDKLREELARNFSKTGRCYFHFPFHKEYCLLMATICDYMGEVEEVEGIPDRRYFRTCEYANSLKRKEQP